MANERGHGIHMVVAFMLAVVAIDQFKWLAGDAFMPDVGAFRVGAAVAIGVLAAAGAALEWNRFRGGEQAKSAVL